MLADAELVVRRVLNRAAAGDMVAAKLVLDRVLPRRVCVTVAEVPLPPLTNAEDAVRAVGVIASAALDGRISPIDAAALVQIIESFRKLIESADHERRITELEECQKARNEPPTPFPYRAP